MAVSGALCRRLLGEGGIGGSHGRSLNQATPSVVELQLAVQTATPSGTLAALNQASQAGTLGIVLSAMGLTLVPGSLTVVSPGSPAAARAAAPSAAPGQVSSVPPPTSSGACLPPAPPLLLVRPALKAAAAATCPQSWAGPSAAAWLCWWC